MPKYVAQAEFGPWKPGDKFESSDERYAKLAEKAHLLAVDDGGAPAVKAPKAAKQEAAEES